MKKYGTAAVEDACATAIDIGVHEYRFVRRYLERRPHPQMFLRQIGRASCRERGLILVVVVFCLLQLKRFSNVTLKVLVLITILLASMILMVECGSGNRLG